MSKRIYPVTVENGELVESNEKLTVNGLPIAKDGTIDSSYVSGSGSSEWEVDANGDLVPVDGEPVSVGSLISDELLGIADRIFTGGESVTDINSALATAGNTVVLDGDHSTLSDIIEIGANDVTLVIQSGATVGLDSNATPTTLASANGGDLIPFIYNNGFNNVTVSNHGVINPKNDSFSAGASAVFFDSATNGHVQSPGGVLTDIAGGVWLVDCGNTTVTDIYSDNHDGAVAVGEGCTECTWRNLRGDGSTDTGTQGEVLDLNGINEHCDAQTIIGAGDIVQVVDSNGNRNCTISNVIGRGSPDTLVQVVGTSSPHFSSKTVFGDGNNMTFDGVKGVTAGNAIVAHKGNPVQNLTLTNLDVESTGDVAVSFSAETNQQFNNLRIEGRVVSSSTKQAIMHHAGSTNATGSETTEQVHINVDAVASSSVGVVLRNCIDVTGEIITHDCGDHGALFGVNSGGSFTDSDVTVISKNNGGDGLYIGGVDTISDNTFRGVAENNTGSDVNVANATDTRVDMDYGTRTDSGTRTVWKGLGYNGGDPSAGGDWNGNGFEGVVVRDTTNANTYIYNNGGWSQIASA